MSRYHQALAVAICYAALGAAQTSIESTPTSMACGIHDGSTVYSVTSTPLATSLASCETFYGNVLVSNPYTSGAVFDLTGLRTISQGSLAITWLPNGTVTSSTPLDIATEYAVNGTEGLYADLTVLSANAYTEINYHPPVPTFPADPTMQISLGSVLSLRNTSRSSANFTFHSGTDVMITDNPLLLDVSLSGSVPGNITIRASGTQTTQGGCSIDLGNMTAMNNVEIRDATSIRMKPLLTSTTSLTQISGNVSIVNNSIIEFQASSLQTVLHSLTFVDNLDLNFLSLPALAYVGGDFRIVGSPNFNETSTVPRILQEGTSDFTIPALNRVGGSFELSGSFTGLQLDSLSSVAGDMTINTTRNMSCQAAAKSFASLTSKSFTCKSANDTFSNVADSDKTTTSGGTRLSSAAKAGIGLGASFGVIACAAIVFAKTLPDTYHYDQPQQTSTYDKAELPNDDVRLEMGEDEACTKAPQELVATPARRQGKSIPVTSVLVEAPGDMTWPVQSVHQQVTPASLTSSDEAAGTGSTGVSPMSSPGVRGSRIVRGLSPLSSPSSLQSLRQTPAGHDRPVSAISTQQEHQAVHRGLATVDESG
ncbi:hypothetical protein AMS68_007620 [Peltaster fructicola]|uniref:Receptor L-domain domain-containing protein n=1 Tax=Peltaster fructicola TaxID=286661 RepID=A0A6H0Y525_9PEZI|nr:hypothetical protein AMS68_007620 [Peltaster fructicola]